MYASEVYFQVLDIFQIVNESWLNLPKSFIVYIAW